MPLRERKILVVDDDANNRKVLKKFLSNLNYEVIECENGAAAVDSFEKNNVDLVLMDVMMPIMNGMEATTRIKQLSVNNFVPVLILTALNSDDEMRECIDAGADDFISKPINLKVLESKILAFERIHSIYQETKKTKDVLKRDQGITQKIFDEAITNNNLQLASLKTWYYPKQCTSEEIFLIARTPSNGINLLFGKMSVAGLAAAIGALPTAEVFRAMTNKGFSPPDILTSINKKLHNLLPEGIFLSAIFIHIHESLSQINCCNCNMPSFYLLDDKTNVIADKVNSTPIKLGTKALLNTSKLFQYISIKENQKLILSSLTEQEFLSSNIKNLTHNKELRQSCLTIMKNNLKNLEEFDAVYNCNFAMIELVLDNSIIPEETEVIHEISEKALNLTVREAPSTTDIVELEIKLQGKKLGTIDPVPIIINYLDSVSNIGSHREALFTILTELYTNALDHGVLGLKSSLKKTAEGFARYFELRNDKLNKMNEGFILIRLNLSTGEIFNSLNISIQDSGPGFDINQLSEFKADELMFSGRGIALVKGLCEKFEFLSPGNQVVATYCWPAN